MRISLENRTAQQVSICQVREATTVLHDRHHPPRNTRNPECCQYFAAPTACEGELAAPLPGRTLTRSVLVLRRRAGFSCGSARLNVSYRFSLTFHVHLTEGKEGMTIYTLVHTSCLRDSPRPAWIPITLNSCFSLPTHPIIVLLSSTLCCMQIFYLTPRDGSLTTDSAKSFWATMIRLGKPSIPNMAESDL